MTPKLTIQEAAQMLRRSPKTLYGWTSRKTIPHLKIGGRLLFDEQELEAWMNEFRVMPPENQEHKH